jgi:hypothetical protein
MQSPQYLRQTVALENLMRWGRREIYILRYLICPPIHKLHRDPLVSNFYELEWKTHA